MTLEQPRFSQTRQARPPLPNSRYVRYHDDVEMREDDEDSTIDGIIEAMRGESRITEERYGKAVRTSHAKSHGLAKGELRVLDDLPPALRQGLFADAKSYPAIVRLAHVPGEFLDDSKVSTPRGMAIKLFDVEGDKLPSHAGQVTQDFLLDTGRVFPSLGPKSFLATIKSLEMATPAPEILKQVVSVTSRATNAALNAVGANSPNLDFFGHPPRHPLSETYYSQTPYRYGDYIAKIRVRPVTPALVDMQGEKLDVGDDENALRTAVTTYFRAHPAEYEVAVQLCTDLDDMPIENAHSEWDEDDSPYIPVARLLLPAQDAYSPARQAWVEALSFNPAHTLQAHRPLGGINRARLKAYGLMAAARRQHNGASVAEPRSIDEVPD